MITLDYVKLKQKRKFLYGYGETTSLYSAYMTKLSVIQSSPDFKSRFEAPLNQGNDAVTKEMISKYGGRWSENSAAIEEFYSKMITIIDGLLASSTITPVAPVAPVAPVTPVVAPTVTPTVTPAAAIITISGNIKEYLPYIAVAGLLIILLIRRR